MDRRVRELIAEKIHLSPKRRQEIAEQMGALLGQHVTVAMLDNFTAPSRTAARFPAAWVGAFCQVMCDDELQRLLLSPRLRRLLDLAERELAIARTECERRTLRSELLADEDDAEPAEGTEKTR